MSGESKSQSIRRRKRDANADLINSAIEMLGNITPTPKFQDSIDDCDPELMSSEACKKLQKYLWQYRIKLRKNLKRQFREVFKNQTLNKQLVRERIKMVTQLSDDDIDALIKKAQKKNKKVKKSNKGLIRRIMGKIPEAGRAVGRSVDTALADLTGSSDRVLTVDKLDQILGDDYETVEPMMVHLRLMEELTRAATMPVKAVLSMVNISSPGFDTSIADIIRAWFVSTVNAAWQLFKFDVAAGWNAGKTIFSIPKIVFGGFNDVADAFGATVKNLMYFSAVMILIVAQFEAFKVFIVAMDYVFGSDYGSLAATLCDQYVQFLQDTFYDSLMMIPNMFCYIIFGFDSFEKSPEGIVAGLKSSQRIWYIVRGVIDVCWNLIARVIQGLMSKRTIKFMYDGTTGGIGTIWNIIKMLSSQASEWAAAAAEAAAAAAEAARQAAEELANAAIAKLTPVFLELSDAVKNGLGNLVGKMYAALPWSGTATAGAIGTGLRPYTALTVCGLLGITKAQFDNLENKELVNYVNKTPLNDFGLVHAVYHTHRELCKRPRLALQDKPKLRF